MRCPSCDATIRDDEGAAFCPRCGRALGATEAQATVELSGEEGVHDGTTREISGHASVEETGDTATPSKARLADVVASVSRSAASAGWTGAATVASFGFLTAVALGAMLVLGAKLQYPSVGSDAGPFAGLEVMVMAGLAVLGAPVAIGDLSLSALPLGALAIVGWAVVWGTRNQLSQSGRGDVRSAVVAGAKVGVPLALICLVAALFFRIGAEPSPIRSNPVASFLVGGLWGTAFGALGGFLVAADVRTRARRVAARLAERSRLLYEGVVAGVLMLTATFVLGAILSLLWVAMVLVRGPSGFGWGEAFAALIYMVAFAPNVVMSVIAVALGAPVEVGAQVTVDGTVVGPLKEISVFSGGLSPIAFALFLVPLAACFVAGYSAHRTTTIPKQGAAVLGVAALAYAFVLVVVAILADARLGAGLVRSRGFALIAPDSVLVFAMALAWAAVIGYLGWWYAERPFPGRSGRDMSGVPAVKARTGG